MKIYELNTFCGVKSTGRIASDIADLVTTDGGECRIGYGADEPSAASRRYAYRIGTPAERKVHGAIRKLLDGEGLGSAEGTKRLIADMRAFQPDVVHLHNIHGCYLNHELLCKYLRRSGVPVVWTLHDCWPFTGHCAYFDYCGCEKWVTGCERCPQQKSYPVCIGLDRSRSNYARKKKLFASLANLTLVTPCEWMKQPLSRSFLKDVPVRVIYNGVDSAVFHPTDSDLRTKHGLDGKKLLLSVASEWDARKGLRYLEQAMQALGDGYRAVVIGLSKQQIAALPDGFIGLEHTQSTDELAAWYTAADCFVNPTMEDNMPMVNLESLACGTPVAAFDTGGCAEAVDDSCGMIVPKGDVDGLCAAIRTLCQRKPVDACLARARRFDGADTYREYVDLYKELCK